MSVGDVVSCLELMPIKNTNEKRTAVKKIRCQYKINHKKAFDNEAIFGCQFKFEFICPIQLYFKRKYNGTIDVQYM